jgi:HTH-type transcriptional regulator / antitoxin HigA
MEGRIMKTRKALQFEAMPKEYAGLCRRLIPRRISDPVEYGNVAEITDAMVLWQDDFTADQRDYFDLLCGLMEDYDREQVRWPKISVGARLQHLLEESGLSAADLSRLLGGSRNLGSMILRGDRNLTVAHIRRLADHFRVSPELFI